MNIYDIAKEANVSTATVSRVLNNSGKVSEKTRERVLSVVNKYGYSPNVFARGLMSASLKTIGVLTVDIRDMYYATVAYTIEQEFEKLGYSVILCNTGVSAAQKERYIAMLTEKQVDGMIFVGSVFRDDTISATIEETAQKIPCVIVNGHVEGAYSVVCDEADGAAQCVQYLYQKGRSHILFLQNSNTYSSQNKGRGYEAAMREFGGEPRTVAAGPGIDGGYHAVESLLREGVTVDAILASEDVCAVGALKALLVNGRRVPDETALFGFNNSEFCSCSIPSLSSVDNRMEEMGRQAVFLLYNILNGKEPQKKTIVPPNLVLRGTTP